MTRIVHFLLLLALLALCGSARAAHPVRRMPVAPTTDDYQTAAHAAGFPWGNEGENEAVSHVLLRLEERGLTLTVGLPADTSLGVAEEWMQELVDSLGWSRARLYSYRAPGQLRLAAQTRIEVPAAGPFHRRAVFEVGVLQHRLQRVTRRPALLCMRVIDATVTSVVPPPHARVERGGATYLFYSALPASPAWLAVNYGLSARQIAALLAVLVLALLFPLGPHLAFRSHLQKQPKLTDERRSQLYTRWQRWVRIVGILGTYLTFVLLGYGAIPRSSMSTMPSVWPLWWWYGTLEWCVPLPNMSAESGEDCLKRFPRWVTYTGLIASGALTMLIMLLSASMSVQSFTGLVSVLLWLIAICFLAAIAISMCMALWTTRHSGRLNQPPTATVDNEPGTAP